MAILNMLPEELRELMADIAHVKLQDIHLGRVLEKMTTHLAHAHGLDPNAATDETSAEEEEEAAPAPVKGGKK